MVFLCLKLNEYGTKHNKPTLFYLHSLLYNYISGTNKLKNVIDGLNDPDTKLGDFRTSSLHPASGSKSSSTTDYSYDGNGNMVKDLNKDIVTYANANGIIYNHLNLPQKITVRGASADKGTIEYVYDATGNKLKKITTEGTKVTTTLYLGGSVFVNDTLQFLAQEEGRIRFKQSDTSLQYDYFVKDHLGNVRMVLTEEQQTDAYPVASMEAAQATMEEAFYSNLAATRENKPSGYPTDTYTNPNDKVAKTNGNGNKIGPSMILKVMAGDKFNLRVNSWWNSGNSPGTPVSPLTDLVTALSNSVASLSGGKATSSELSSSGISNSAATGFLGSQTYNSSKPKAFVNWVFLDEQFKYYAGGFEQVGNSNTFTTHSKTGEPINKSGYLYIYVSNETPNIDVFFDNLQVTHIRGPILEETHYYPFGLTMAGISSKALAFGEPKNKENTFQGQRFDDELGVSYVQFKWRNHDPQIGRFIEIDPLSHKYVYNSTYAFSENRVIDGVELEGLEWREFGKMFSSAGIDVDYQNRKAQAQITHLAEKAQPVIAVTKDLITIAAGVTLMVASAGTATPFIVGLAGSASIAGGTMKLMFDLQGNTEASSQIPTTLSGTAVFLGNGISESATGNKLVSDDVKTVLEFSEGMLTLNVTGFDKMTDVQKVSNILSGLSVTLEGLSPDLGTALQNIIRGQLKIIPQTNVDNTGKKASFIPPEPSKADQ